MVRPVTAAPLAEAEAFLAAHPDVAFIDLVYTNLAGVPRGKRLRRHELAAAYADGRYLPGSLLVVDITGLDVGESGMIWADGDADRLAWPVPGTLAPSPWQGADSATALLAMHELDGRACTLDPRAILRRVLDRFAADGLVPVVACELEFYLLDEARTPDGGIQVAAGRDGRRSAHSQVFGIAELDAAGGFLRDLWAACDAMAVPAGAALAEYAPGQFEVTLAHRDALTAADDAVRFKHAAKGVAAAHGHAATFMAKPFADRSGSGLHLHVSVDDAHGDNMFAAESLSGTRALRQAIGGVTASIADAMAIFAPNANSYRRFRPNSHAPVRAGWGLNNRTVPVRIPAGPAASRRFEHRVSGADANPYLAVAAVLAGVHDGLRRRVDPGPPTVGDGDGDGAGERLPTDWAYAIERLARSSLLTDYLGAEAVEMFATVKRVEHERYSAIVTPLDYDWVLRSA